MGRISGLAHRAATIAVVLVLGGAGVAHADITAHTSDATDLTPTAGHTLSATLNGGVFSTAFIAGATYHFEYGPSFAYGTSAPAQDAAADCFQNDDASVSCSASTPVMGLQRNTLYHFRIVGSVNGQQYLGADNTLYAGVPVDGTPPQVTGTAQSGQTLSATTGGWSFSSGNVTASYQWRRCDSGGGACSDIAGATGTTLLLSGADVGATIVVRVTQTDPTWGAASASSDPTAVVAAAPPGLPQNTQRPGISGTPAEGQSLTFVAGQWNASPSTTYTHRWQRCDASGGACADIPGATGSTYTLTHDDAGATIVVVETASNEAGQAASASLPTATVAAAASSGGGASTTTPGGGDTPPPVGLAPVRNIAIEGHAPTAALGAAVALRAQGLTRDVTAISWTVQGATAADCQPNQSQLTYVPQHTGTLDLAAHVTYADGQTAVSTTNLTVLAPHRRARAHAASVTPKLVHDFALCESTPTDPVKATLGPNLLASSLSCDHPSNVEYGLVDARGCWASTLGDDDVADPERTEIDRIRRLAATFKPSELVALGLPVREATGLRVAGGMTVTSAELTTALSTIQSQLVYASDRDGIRINGLDVKPMRGHDVVIVPSLSLLLCTDAQISIDSPVGPIVVQKRGLVEQFIDADPKNPKKTLPLTDFDLTKPIPLLGSSLPLKGTLRTALTYHAATIAAHIALPQFALTLDGHSVDATTTFTADNAHGLRADDATFDMPKLDFGLVGLFGVHLEYHRHKDGRNNVLDVGANARFGATAKTAVTIYFSPPIPGVGETSNNKSDYGLHFVDGNLVAAGAGVSLPGGGVPIGPGVNLTRVGASFGLHPTRASIQGGLKALGIADIDGDGWSVFASDSEPYTLRDDDVPGGWFNVLPRPTFTSFAMGVQGKASLKLPGIDFDFAKMGWVTDGQRLLLYGGTSGQELGLWRYSLDVAGDVDVTKGFDVSAKGEIDVPAEEHLGMQGVLNAKALVGTRGIYACGTGTLKNPLHDLSGSVWLGHRWSDGAIGLGDVHLGSCGDMGPYRAVGGSRAAGGEQTFTIAPGTPGAQLDLHGDGGAPSLTVTDPSGQVAAPSTALVMRDPETDEAVVYLQHPAPGTWRVVPDATSVPVTSLAIAAGLPPAHPTATVSPGTGRRTVRFGLTPAAERSVDFLESGPGGVRDLGRGGARPGSFTFRPADGLGTRRTLIAQLIQHGVPTERFVVAHYTVAAPAGPAVPAGVRITRRGRRAVVRWQRAAGAASYDVALTTARGEHDVVQTRGTHATFDDVPPSVAVRADVTGVDATGRSGRPATTRGARLTPHSGLRP